MVLYVPANDSFYTVGRGGFRVETLKREVYCIAFTAM